MEAARGSTPGELPTLPVGDPGIRRHYLLALPDGVTADEVEVLALSRFPGATWQVPPRTALPGSAARPSPGVLRLSRHTTLTGPYGLGPRDAVGLGLPASTASVFDVTTPRERGERPYPGGDRDGLKRVFPDGMPVREEERVVLWLVSTARRLRASIRTGDAGVVLTPDPDATIDLTIFTYVWLEPEESLGVMQRAVPRARLALDGVDWEGPMSLPDELRPPVDVLGDEVRARLHAEADAYDMAALSAPDQVDGYAIVADLTVDGLLTVEVGDEDTLPPILQGLPWTEHGAIAYRVRWTPPDPDELELEKPSHAHRIARSRAVRRVNGVTKALHAAVGGEIADADEFLVDAGDLES